MRKSVYVANVAPVRTETLATDAISRVSDKGMIRGQESIQAYRVQAGTGLFRPLVAGFGILSGLFLFTFGQFWACINCVGVGTGTFGLARSFPNMEQLGRYVEGREPSPSVFSEGFRRTYQVSDEQLPPRLEELLRRLSETLPNRAE